jgi:hypothetical protein
LTVTLSLAPFKVLYLIPSYAPISTRHSPQFVTKDEATQYIFLACYARKKSATGYNSGGDSNIKINI